MHVVYFAQILLLNFYHFAACLDCNSNFFIFQSVPIFALHPLGSYYIPMVVNYGLLAPFLTVLEEPRPGTGLTLHPVIILIFTWVFRMT